MEIEVEEDESLGSSSESNFSDEDDGEIGDGEIAEDMEVDEAAEDGAVLPYRHEPLARALPDAAPAASARRGRRPRSRQANT